MASEKREKRPRPDLDQEMDVTSPQSLNTKLSQDLEDIKTETHSLNEKIRQLKDYTNLYDNSLMTLNKIWNQLDDDLVLLGIRAGGHPDDLHALNHADFVIDKDEELSADDTDDTFLYRLLRHHPTDSSAYIQDALARRHSATKNLMKHISEIIAAHEANVAIFKNSSSDDAIMQIKKFHQCLKKQAYNLYQAIDGIHQKHRVS